MWVGLLNPLSLPGTSLGDPDTLPNLPFSCTTLKPEQRGLGSGLYIILWRALNLYLTYTHMHSHIYTPHTHASDTWDLELRAGPAICNPRHQPSFYHHSGPQETLLHISCLMSWKTASNCMKVVCWTPPRMSEADIASESRRIWAQVLG